MNLIKKYIKIPINNYIKKKEEKYLDDKKPDYILFYLSSSLIICSVIIAYSLSIYTVVIFDYSQFHFFIRQLATGMLGIFIMWILSQMKPDEIIEGIGWMLFGIFLFLMILMSFNLVPMTESGGANRWIRLPLVSIAPIEFFKIGFIFLLAFSFQRKLVDLPKVKFIEEVKILIPHIIVFMFALYFIAVEQKDFGQTLVLISVLFILLLFANRSWKLFLSLFSIGVAGAVLLILYAPHRINRIKDWWAMNQDSVLYLVSYISKDLAEFLRVDAVSLSQQVNNSLNAMYNGGFFGVGLGEGALKLGFLAEVHTDFVLAGLTEELGLLGFLFILTILSFILIRIFEISKHTLNVRYHLFTLGIAIMIIMSFIINSFGISSIIPMKGIAVPFLSYGGSSILSISIAIGMVLSISREVDFDKTKFFIKSDEKKVRKNSKRRSIRNIIGKRGKNIAK